MDQLHEEMRQPLLSLTTDPDSSESDDEEPPDVWDDEDKDAVQTKHSDSGLSPGVNCLLLLEVIYLLIILIVLKASKRHM